MTTRPGFVLEVDRSTLNPVWIDRFNGSDPLPALLRPGMKLTIAFDDISLPLPPMKSPDIRQRVIEQVLDMAAAAGIHVSERRWRRGTQSGAPGSLRRAGRLLVRRHSATS